MESQAAVNKLKKDWMVTKQHPDGLILVETNERIVPAFEVLEGKVVCLYVSIDLDTGTFGFPAATSVPDRLAMARQILDEKGFWLKEAAKSGLFGSQRTAAFVRPA